jgi:hypothetical protein
MGQTHGTIGIMLGIPIMVVVEELHRLVMKL